MELQKLADCLEKRVVGEVAIDSRKVKPRGVFFALPGDRVAGEGFLSEVAARGGEIAVVQTGYQGESFGLELVRVDNVLATLHSLAGQIFAGRQVQVVGVTGSVGKTTTKEFIATLLAEKFSVEKTPLSCNAQATFPLAILNSDRTGSVFVMEMGMSFPGEIGRLVQMAPPDIAFIGKIALAHAENFDEGLEGIARAKGEILSHSKTRLAVIHGESVKFAPLNVKIPKITYGQGDYVLQGDSAGWRILERGTSSPEFQFPFEASHLRENFLGAVAVARALGMSWEEILRALPKLALLPGRFERIERGGVVFMNDSYNASPTSVRAALENLPVPKGAGRRIGVLGEITHLGRFSEKEHRDLGSFALDWLDVLFCLGTRAGPAFEAFRAGGREGELFVDLEQLKGSLFSLIRPGDVVLIKGSHSKEMWRLLE